MQSLLGMLVFFMHYGPFWLHDQELWTGDEDIFCSFFSNTSEAWKGLMEKSDQELMLKENCRAGLKKVLMKLQHDINSVSDDLFSDLDDQAKLSIFTDEEMEEYGVDDDDDDGDEEGEDGEDEDNDDDDDEDDEDDENDEDDEDHMDEFDEDDMDDDDDDDHDDDDEDKDDKV
jgi:hypothetical protein